MAANPNIHLVFGPPAAGKTIYARELAGQIGAVLLDSDEVTERLIRAGLTLAGLNPDDRDSPAYKSAFRDAVYETLFDLASSHCSRLPVVIAGPFTSEGGDADWPERLAARFGVMPEFHYVWCQPEERKARIRAQYRMLGRLFVWSGWNAHLLAKHMPAFFPSFYALLAVGPVLIVVARLFWMAHVGLQFSMQAVANTLLTFLVSWAFWAAIIVLYLTRSRRMNVTLRSRARSTDASLHAH